MSMTRAQAKKRLLKFEMMVYNATTQWLAADTQGDHGWSYDECAKLLRNAIGCMHGYLRHQVNVVADTGDDDS